MEEIKHGMAWLIIFFSVSLSLGSSKSSVPNYRSEEILPYFTSQEKTYTEQIGNTLTLICHVENLGSSTLIWKKDGRIISAGETIIRKDPRLNLIGYNLDINELMEEDAGEYVCEIETYGDPLDQVHTVEVLVPPRVESKPVDGKFVVRKGSTITLECNTSGNPSPTITWTRQNNILPSGVVSVSGESIVLVDVTRHDTGVYICTANNGVGQPAMAHIELTVLYPPEIVVDQTWIKTSDGIEAEVTCNVHAEPKAEVKWYKETMLLDPTNNRHMETYGNKHVLLLTNVNKNDFGNYSCLSDNSLGRQSAGIEVSGRPHQAKVASPQLSNDNDQYNLSWTVDSFLPILEYRILYRVMLDNNEKRFGVNKHKHTEWTNIIPPTLGQESKEFKNSFTFSGSFSFYQLSPSTDYQVIIQSRNEEGWSDPSNIFTFTTRHKDFDPRRLHLQESNNKNYFSGGSTPIFSSSSLLLTLLVAISH